MCSSSPTPASREQTHSLQQNHFTSLLTHASSLATGRHRRNNFLLSLLIGAWIGKNSRSSRGSCKPRISKSPKIAKAVCVRRIHLYFRHFPCPHSQRLRSHSKICRWEGRRSTKDSDFPQIPSNWMVLIFHSMNFKARPPFEPRWPNLILFGLSVESEVWITVLLACWTAGFLTDLHREIWTSWSPAKDRTLQLEANWKVIKPQHIMKVTVAYRVPTMYQALKQALCILSAYIQSSNWPTKQLLLIIMASTTQTILIPWYSWFAIFCKHSH